MKSSVAQKRLNRLELELRQLKRIIFGQKPDLAADEKVWQKVKKDVRESRAKVFRRRYGKG